LIVAEERGREQISQRRGEAESSGSESLLGGEADDEFGVAGFALVAFESTRLR
jgi:hypothetical protein